MDDDGLQTLTLQRVARPLEAMSIGELKDYVTDMEAEIQRVRDVIAVRERHRQKAESFFRK